MMSNPDDQAVHRPIRENTINVRDVTDNPAFEPESEVPEGCRCTHKSNGQRVYNGSCTVHTS